MRDIDQAEYAYKNGFAAGRKEAIEELTTCKGCISEARLPLDYATCVKCSRYWADYYQKGEQINVKS